MKDNIILRKVWMNNDMAEVEVICSSSMATAVSKIYVCDEIIDELRREIDLFLRGCMKEGFWISGEFGNDSTACVSFRFIRKDRQGHIWVEVFMELDDGGGFDTHNCCFYVNTEYGMLMNFCKSLHYLKTNPTGFELRLNHWFE